MPRCNHFKQWWCLSFVLLCARNLLQFSSAMMIPTNNNTHMNILLPFSGSLPLGSSAFNFILKLSCYQSIKVVEEDPFLECFLSSQETSMQYDKNGQKKQGPNQSITQSVGIAHIVLTHFLLCLMNRLSAIYVNQEFYIWKAGILKPKALINTRWNNHLDILLAVFHPTGGKK